jgi:hypothetical protein
VATTYKLQRTEPRVAVIVLRVIVVGLTLATAAIHSTLGGVLFTLNAIGYTTFAAAMLLPGPVARIRWLVRLALIGFTLATIGGWLLFGARFPLAYLDKTIELALVVAVSVELWLSDGGPMEIARRVAGLPATVVRILVPRP